MSGRKYICGLGMLLAPMAAFLRAESRGEDMQRWRFAMSEVARDLKRHLIAAGFEEVRRPGVITQAGLQLVSEIAESNRLKDWIDADDPEEFGRLRDLVVEHLKRQQLLP